MDALRQYIISITAAAVICGIAKSISDEKTMPGTLIRLIAGIIMTVTVLSPAVSLNLQDLPLLSGDLAAEAEAAAAAGEEMAMAQMNLIISDRVTAYILDKAVALGADVQVQVTMSEDGSGLPTAIILSGSVSPYVKARLQSIIEDDLQIPKEDQQWIG